MGDSRSPLFILEGNGQCTNRGCEAILWSTLMILDRTFDSSSYINSPAKGAHLASCNVKHARLVHLTPPKRLSKMWRVFRKKLNPQYMYLAYGPYLKDATAVLVLGGDNLSLDYGVPDRHFHVIDRILQADRPVVIWGASIGPFTERPDLERNYMESLKRVSLICVRETLTQQYLAREGVTDNVALVVDPAFVLPTEPVRLPEELETALSDGAIGINLSPLLARYQDNDVSWTRKAAGVLQAVDQALDYPIVLVPHVFKTNTNDHGFLSDAMKLLGKTRNPIVLVGPNYNACQLKWIIGRTRLFVGARAHAIIAALSSCVPAISIGYSVKALGINLDIFGHLDWLIASEQLTPAMISDVVVQLNDNLTAVSQHLVSKMPDYQERAWNSGDLLKEICR